MERLTNSIDYCQLHCDFGKEKDCFFQDKTKCYEKNMYEKLKSYEDAEEKGLILRLPCNVGDTVYKLWYKPCHNGEDYPDSYSCCGCEDECDLKRSMFAFTVPSLAWILQHIGRFGEGVWYLKREEAEKALKRMESE